MKNKLIVLLLIGAAATSTAQQGDTILISEKSFLVENMRYAPLIRNSDLSVQIQRQNFEMARAAFEPKLKGGYNTKNFDQTNYYSKFQGELEVKTPLGISVKSGLADNGGVFLNPENKTPLQGLAYGGLEIPLGAGMFTDADRTFIREQSIQTKSAQQINLLNMNDYLFEAGKAYWKWYGDILLLQLRETARIRTETRLQFVKQREAIGEAAGIDTLEAYINLQNRTANWQEQQINWFATKTYLSNFLWNDNTKRKLHIPQISRDTLRAPKVLDDQLIALHPVIQIIDYDSAINELQVKLNREFYKPTINLDLQLQTDATSLTSNGFDNHYAGVSVYLPALYRKQRAKSEQLRLKQSVLAGKKDILITKIRTEAETYLTNSETLKNTAELWENASRQYFKLLQAEQQKFQLGESSLFIVNNRELMWLDAREKYIESFVKYRISLLAYYHALALLPLQFDDNI